MQTIALMIGVEYLRPPSQREIRACIYLVSRTLHMDSISLVLLFTSDVCRRCSVYAIFMGLKGLKGLKGFKGFSLGDAAEENVQSGVCDIEGSSHRTP